MGDRKSILLYRQKPAPSPTGEDGQEAQDCCCCRCYRRGGGQGYHRRSSQPSDSIKRAGGYRSTLRPASYIPSASLQVIAAAYCLFALPGRQGAAMSPDLGSLLRPLEERTVPSLWKVLVGLLVSQLYFGGQAKRWWDAAEAQKEGKARQGGSDEEDRAAGKKSRKEINQSLAKKIDPLLETCSLTFFAALGIFAVIVLLGGMAGRKHTESLQLSAFLALLAFTPSAYAISSPFAKSGHQTFTKYTWIRLFVWFEPQSDVEVALVAPAYGAVLGCLLSAPALALDWEEPWQTWPLPCIVGTFIGWILGHFAALSLCALLWLGKGKEVPPASHFG